MGVCLGGLGGCGLKEISSWKTPTGGKKQVFTQEFTEDSDQRKGERELKRTGRRIRGKGTIINQKIRREKLEPFESRGSDCLDGTSLENAPRSKRRKVPNRKFVSRGGRDRVRNHGLQQAKRGSQRIVQIF